MIDYNRISTELINKINSILKWTEYEWEFWLLEATGDWYRVHWENFYFDIK